MDGKKIKVISQVDGTVGVFLQNLGFSREWTVKGQVVTFPAEIMEEAMYDPGFKNMVESGVLYIQDPQTAKDLGLEDEDAKIPTRYKRYTETELKRLIVSAPIEEFLETLEVLPEEQGRELCDWAITLRLRDDKKIEALENRFHVNIDKGIYRDKASQE